MLFFHVNSCNEVQHEALMLHLPPFPASLVELVWDNIYFTKFARDYINPVSWKAPIYELYGPIKLLFPKRWKHAFTTLNKPVQWPRSLRCTPWLPGYWDRGFESCSRHGCLSLSVNHSLVTLSSTLYSLVTDPAIKNKLPILSDTHNCLKQKPERCLNLVNCSAHSVKFQITAPLNKP
jgi:hypothetical protein